jgi:cullin-4
MLDDDMVQRLLEFKSFIDAVMSGAFVESHSTPDGEDGAPAPSTSTAPASKPKQDFIYARQDAFTAGFAARPNKPAELLAKHLDQAMRKGQRDLSDAQFARSLDDVLGLYRFTKDKDVFRVFYLRALAKRLLLDRSASDDFEKAILKKLKDGESSTSPPIPRASLN